MHNLGREYIYFSQCTCLKKLIVILNFNVIWKRYAMLLLHTDIVAKPLRCLQQMYSKYYVVYAKKEERIMSLWGLCFVFCLLGLEAVRL